MYIEASEEMTDLDYIEPTILNFRGVQYVVSTIGSRHPRRTISSYMCEIDVRDAFWEVKPDEMVFDVGAGVGSWTLPALVSGAYVNAFEPCRDCMFDLLTQLSTNRIHRCLPVNVLMGAEFTWANYVPEHHSMIRSDGATETRLVMTVDQYLKVCPRLDWLKVDVEGAETFVLRGAENMLKERRPKLVVETHPQFLEGIEDEVGRYLAGLDYVAERFKGTQLTRWMPK